MQKRTPDLDPISGSELHLLASVPTSRWQQPSDISAAQKSMRRRRHSSETNGTAWLGREASNSWPGSPRRDGAATTTAAAANDTRGAGRFLCPNERQADSVYSPLSLAKASLGCRQTQAASNTAATTASSHVFPLLSCGVALALHTFSAHRRSPASAPLATTRHPASSHIQPKRREGVCLRLAISGPHPETVNPLSRRLDLRHETSRNGPICTVRGKGCRRGG